MKKHKVGLSIMRFLMIAVACDMSGSKATEEQPPTETPLPPLKSTDTPEPTVTPDLVATEAVKSTQAAEEAMTEIEQTIEDYEIDADLEGGHIGWVQEEPVTISIHEYRSYDFDVIADEEDFADFILRSNVTWESTGWAFCGFIFRSEKDLDKGAQYQFAAIRFSGAPVYWIEYWDNGDFVYSPIGRGRSNSAIDLDNGATNEFILYARGSTLSAYANGTRLTNADISKVKDGKIAFYGFQDSGETQCKFEDTWLYVLSDQSE
jgi:hypothetical protein